MIGATGMKGALMKRLFLNRSNLILCLVCFSFMFVPSASCKKLDDHPPTVWPCTVYGELRFLVLRTRDNDTGKPRVVLKAPTHPAKTVQHYWKRDEKATGDPAQQVVFLSKEDNVTGAPFGRQSYHQISMEGKELKVMAFQQTGEQWAFAIDGILYEDINGKAVKIGTTEFRTYPSETGENRRAYMTKRTGDDAWIFSSDDRVYRQQASGKVAQIGWMQWRVVDLPDGEKIMLMMSKGMGKRARWTGRYQGKTYVGPL
jgi:hypothetical protein